MRCTCLLVWCNFLWYILLNQDPILPNETVIVIRSLVPGGAADQDGRLHPGDRLMSVNDTNLEHASLEVAVQTLKSTAKGIWECWS